MFLFSISLLLVLCNYMHIFDTFYLFAVGPPSYSEFKTLRERGSCSLNSTPEFG